MYTIQEKLKVLRIVRKHGHPRHREAIAGHALNKSCLGVVKRDTKKLETRASQSQQKGLCKKTSLPFNIMKFSHQYSGLVSEGPSISFYGSEVFLWKTSFSFNQTKHFISHRSDFAEREFLTVRNERESNRLKNHETSFGGNFSFCLISQNCLCSFNEFLMIW